LLGGPLQQSSLWSCTTLSYFRCFDVIFFRPPGHYVRNITHLLITLHLFIILLPCVWFEHPGHTYGGFVPSFSERIMTRSPSPLPGSPVADSPRRSRTQPCSHSTGTTIVVPWMNCCHATTSHHASTKPPHHSSFGENHESGTTKMESPPFPPSDGGLYSSSCHWNLSPGEATASSGVGWLPWPCPLARRGRRCIMRLAQSSWPNFLLSA
jgi:hypothetical protein